MDYAKWLDRLHRSVSGYSRLIGLLTQWAIC